MQRAIRLQFGVQAFVVCGLALILSLCFCLAMSGGQEPSDISNSGDRTVSPDVRSADTTLRVRSDLVLIPVTVTDGRGRAVSGLEKEHFTLFEDNAPQKITHFAAEDAPASIGILFDASDSMGRSFTKRGSPLTLS